MLDNKAQTDKVASKWLIDFIDTTNSICTFNGIFMRPTSKSWQKNLELLYPFSGPWEEAYLENNIELEPSLQDKCLGANGIRMCGPSNGTTAAVCMSLTELLFLVVLLGLLITSLIVNWVVQGIRETGMTNCPIFL